MDKSKIIALVDEWIKIAEPKKDWAGLVDGDDSDNKLECQNHLDSSFLDYLNEGHHLSEINFSA